MTGAPAARRGGLRAIAMGCVVLCGSLAVAGAAAQATAAAGRGVGATVPYVTHDGDTLYAISQQYLQGADDWRQVARLNGVPAPKRLQRGLAIRLPAARLRTVLLAARPVAMHGAVERAGRTTAFGPLAADATLGEGDRLRTGADGFVTLELTDGTHLSLPPDSEIGLTALHRTVLTQTLSRTIDLKRGSVDSDVTHMKRPDDRFQIRSPSVVAGVRGTRFRVNYDALGDTRTRVEVLAGTVGVGPARSLDPTLVHANFGSIAAADGQVDAPVPLLDAPTLVKPGRVQDEVQVGFDLVPPAGGQAYHVQIASDAGFLDVLREMRVATPQARFDGVPDGSYFVRIAAIDANGLEGQVRTYGFERRRFDLHAEAGPASGGYAFRWMPGRAAAGVTTRYRFVLSASADLSNPIVDQPGMADTRMVIAHLPPGDYYWSVSAEQFDGGRFYEKAGTVNSFTLAR
ncbi:FecR family protein [Burkholderia sp. 3C]